MSTPLYSIETIESDEMLPSLQADWRRLSNACEAPNVFATFDWFRAWHVHFAFDEKCMRRLNVLMLKKGGIVTGISPLIRTVSNRFGFILRRLQFVRRDWDYNDLIVGNDLEGQTKAVADYLARTSGDWDVVDLRDLRYTANAIPRLEAALTRAGLSYRLLHEEERCPYMLIDGPWSEILQRRSSSTRHTFRSQQTRLNKSDKSIRFRMIEDPNQEPGLLQRMIAVEAQKRVGGKLSTPVLGLYPELFASLFETLGAQGWIRVAIMESGDRLLSWHLMFHCGGKLWGYLTAYDLEYSRLSPGSMSLPAIVDYGVSHGYTEYDFLSGEETYKLGWASGFHQTYRLLIWNRRWASRLRTSVYLRMKVARDSPECLTHQA
jgi:CelD/BcsL family acetyltransferase involved in cellulose biosynthesis